MKHKILSILKYILFLGVGVGILLWLVIEQGEERIKTAYNLEPKTSIIQDKYQNYAEFKTDLSDLRDLHGSIDSFGVDTLTHLKDSLENKVLDYFTEGEKLSLGIGKIEKDLSHANYSWVTIAILASLLAHWFRAVRWKLLIEPLGYQPRNITMFFSVMIGYIANLVVPRMGEVSKCAALSKGERIPVDKLIGTVIIERVIDLFCLLFLTILAFVVEIDVILTFLQKATGSEEIFTFEMIGIIVLVLLLIVLGLKIGPKIVLNILSKTKFHYKVFRILAGLRSGLKSLRKLKKRRIFILHTFLIWICYFLMIYLMFPAYGPTENLGPEAGLSSLVIGSFGMIAPVQGGIGAYHWSLQQCLHIYQIPLENGLTLAFIVHTAQTLLIIVFGVLSIVLLPIFSKKKIENG